MEKPVEVRYAGVTVGRSPTTVREVDATGVLIGITEPLPVGTSITLTIEETTVDGTVVAVAESQESGRSAMRVRLADLAAVRLVGGAVDAAAVPVPGAAAPSARAMASPVEASAAPTPGAGSSAATGASSASAAPASSSSSGPPSSELGTEDVSDPAHGTPRGPDSGGGKKGRRKHRR